MQILNKISLLAFFTMMNHVHAIFEYTSESCEAGCWNETNLVLETGLDVCVPVGLGYSSPSYDNKRYQCADGYFSGDTETSASCEICPAGGIIIAGFSTCFPCPIGFYQDFWGQSNFQFCDETYYAGHGSNNLTYKAALQLVETFICLYALPKLADWLENKIKEKKVNRAFIDAIKQRNLNEVEKQLALGANVDATSPEWENFTPLMLAIPTGAYEIETVAPIIECILRYRPNMLVTSKNFRTTALHLANDKGVAQRLVEHSFYQACTGESFDPMLTMQLLSAKDGKGRSTLERTKEQLQEPMPALDLLERLGIRVECRSTSIMHLEEKVKYLESWVSCDLWTIMMMERNPGEVKSSTKIAKDYLESSTLSKTGHKRTKGFTHS